MVKLRWTEEASQTLEDIFRFIAQDNPDAARRVVLGIYDKAQLLVGFPEAGHIYRCENEGQVRILLYGHYRIAYLLRNADDWIDVLGIFHSAMEIDRYL